MTNTEQRRMNGLELFRSLTKVGCLWQGDILDRRWSDRLVVPAEAMPRVLEVLEAYGEGTDYIWFQNAVWIA